MALTQSQLVLQKISWLLTTESFLFILMRKARYWALLEIVSLQRDPYHLPCHATSLEKVATPGRTKRVSVPGRFVLS